MSAYRTDFDETNYMYFLIRDDLLERYNGLCEKVSNNFKKEFYSKSVYNER